MMIITDNNNIILKFDIIVTDGEQALINIIKKYFPNVRRVLCYFHYIQDLLVNLRSYGLYKKKDKKISNIILKKLSLLPIIYKGNLQII